MTITKEISEIRTQLQNERKESKAQRDSAAPDESLDWAIERLDAAIDRMAADELGAAESILTELAWVAVDSWSLSSTASERIVQTRDALRSHLA